MAKPVPRRTIIRTGAWGVPAVTTATAAPALAASPPPVYAITAIPPASDPTTTACTTVPAGTFKFQALRNGNPETAGKAVTITLPTGLRFADGTTTKILLTDAAGRVSLPAITPYGAAGTYTISATYEGKVATQTLTVNAQPGSVTAINRSDGGATTAATFTTTDVPITTAVNGSVSGDQYSSSSPGSGANALVLTSTGGVMTWGRDLGGTRAAPATLSYAGTPLTGMTMIDNWTSIATSDNTTGAVVANSTTAYQVYRNGSTGTLVVAQVTGFTGTILDITADQGHYYLRTTTGIWHWTPTTSGTTVQLTSANLIVSGNVTDFHTWSYRTSSTATLRYGGAAVYGTNSIAIWTDSTTPTVTTLPTGVTTADVKQILTSDSGLMILTKSGDLYSRGAATNDTTTWTKRATGVVDFSMWGFSTDASYLGGIYIDSTGKAYRFFDSSSGPWLTPEVITLGGTPLTNVVQVAASDGTYMLLTADGKVYAAGGNLDNTGRTGAQLVNTGGGFVRDMNVWGLHLGSTYYGGGFVIKGATGC